MKVRPIPIEWNSDLSVFASEPFLKSVGDEYGWLGGIDDSGKTRAILPYTIVHKATVRMVRFRVETIPLDGELDLAEEKAFLNNVVEHFRSIGAHAIIPPTTNAVFRAYPDEAIAAPYGTHIIDISLPEDTLFGNMSSSHRRKIRLAEKAGVQIRDNPNKIMEVYGLVRETFKRSNMGFMTFEAFERMVKGLGERIKIFTAESQGVVQGGIVAPFSSHSAYYVYGGSVSETASGAMNLLHWEAMRWFRAMGVRRYDFCGARIRPEKGSKQEGIAAFKERFGSQLIQGYMWKCSLASVRGSMYSLAIRALRGGDIVDKEHHKLAGYQPGSSPSPVTVAE